MNGVETAQHTRVERRCCIEKLFVDLHQVEALQQSSGPGECHGTVAADGAKDLDAREGAGGPLGFVTKIAAERRGLGLGDDELHERGGVEVHPAATALGTVRE